VDQIKAGKLPATQHLETPELIEWANRIFREATVKDVLVVLNRVRDEEMEGYVRKRLAENGLEPIAVIYEDPSIARSWLRGTPLGPTNAQEDVETVVDKLEAVAHQPLLPGVQDDICAAHAGGNAAAGAGDRRGGRATLCLRQ
jgi:hypothetical protein